MPSSETDGFIGLEKINDDLPQASKRTTLQTAAIAVSAAIVCVAIGLVIGFTVQLAGLRSTTPSTKNIYYDANCARFKEGYKPHEDVEYEAHAPLLLRNGLVWTGDAEEVTKQDILVENGRISKIASAIQPPASAEVVDLGGAFVTPGLVDMHSHVGVYSNPQDVHATQDGNEMTNPAVPQVRAIDAFAPDDPARIEIVKSGVTASQILPGSGNVMGGQALQIKFKRVTTVENMRVKNGPVALKMACGENPKRVYGNRGQLPSSRMGNGWVMREKLSAGKQLLDKQAQYCASESPDSFPDDPSLDNIMALLKGEAVLNIHCYTVVDLEAAMRITEEFNVSISSFHHALEAWKIPDMLKKRDIVAALFAAHFGFKMEGMQASVHAPRLCDEAGVKVALKTDHPVINGRDLLYQAQKAAHYDLSPQAALRAVTTVPATAIGLGNRIGVLAVGMDADIVAWDRHPLRLGANALGVWIEGISIVKPEAQYGSLVKSNAMTYRRSRDVPRTLVAQPSSACNTADAKLSALGSYAVRGPWIYLGNDQMLINGTIVVENAGMIVPGFISVGSALGLVEVGAEDAWNDGVINTGSDKSTSYVRAIDGVSVDTIHVRAAWAGGVLTSIARPRARGNVLGASSAFFMGPNNMFLKNGTIINAAASLDIQLGNAAKGSNGSPSVSQQVAQLRSLFQEWIKSHITDPLSVSTAVREAFAGNIPIVFWTDSAEQILAIIRMLDELKLPSLKIIFGGAAEGWLVADEIARVSASVILYRCQMDGFESRRCSNDAETIQAFSSQGVKIGWTVRPGEVDSPRELRWELGMVLERGVASQIDAINTVTTNLARMYMLPSYVGAIVEGGPANFVAYNGDPLSLESSIELVASTTQVKCNPVQL